MDYFFADRLENKTKTHKTIRDAQSDLPYNIKILYKKIPVSELDRF
jgi:hypothetical protein